MDRPIALVISLYILWQIRQVLLLAAVVLATALNRLARRFQGRRAALSGVLLSIAILLTIIVGFSG